MAGKHRRRPAHIPVPAQRRPRPIGITDANTGIEHLMSDEVAAQRRRLGSYLALCGTQVLAASLVAPGRGHCPVCHGR
ncbi:MAG: hypothetical protein ACRDS0_21565 [Pseudonocardiaceae bacterium]